MSTSFNPLRGLVFVEARVWGPAGHRALLQALDTGAGTTVIHPQILVGLGYDLQASPGRVQITTGSGTALAPLLQVGPFEALGQVRQRFEVLCHALPPTAPFDGLLGLDFLRGQCLTIDFRAGQITLA